MASNMGKMHKTVVGKLWRADLESAGRLKAAGIKLLRLAYLFAMEISEEQLAMRAMSLVYTTLLAIVPLLAVSFSVLKAFGVHTRLLILLYYFLEPLGPQGTDIALKVIEFVENVKVSVIGSIGLAGLIYTVMSAIQKLESALNYIWGVKGTRGFAGRFNNYMSMLLAGPVLIFSAAGAVTTAANLGFVRQLAEFEPFGTIIYTAGRLMPYFFVGAAFTFIYYALPNTKVGFRPALTGGFFAGVLWVAVGQTFTFLIASPAKYSAIYSGFATMILFLIWLYWNFFILLIGARIAFYTQHPDYIELKQKKVRLNIRSQERLALGIMLLIGRNFYYNRPPWRLDSISSHLGLLPDTAKELLELLEDKGLIVSSGDDPPAFFPARDLETISVKEIAAIARSYGEDRPDRKKAPAVFAAEAAVGKMENAASDAVDGISLKSLVLSSGEQTSPE